MDKIKILAAALALAGCMENGMGMEENEINGHNVIIRSLENDKLEKIIEKSNSYDISSVTFDGIDFSEEYNEELLNEFLYEKSDVTFKHCTNFPYKMPGIQHVHALELDNCDISLRAAEMFVYANCTLYYLYNFTYQSAAHDSMYKKDISTNMMSYFGLENIVINVK